ncbi:MAG TPA: hypothetical protein VHV30_14000 [Polyangiaceae bacterium]|nr:hypothetical protein [Polyangiaceae bacterium]
MSKEDWRVLRVEVLVVARQVIRPRERAEAMTQEAFARLFERRRFDEASVEGFEAFSKEQKLKALELHVLGIVRSLASGENESASRRRGYEKRAGQEEAALRGTSEASPESVMLENEERTREAADASRHYERLRAQLTGDKFELRVCDALSEDVTKPSELAKHLGCTPQEIYVALRRIRRLMRTIVADERGESYEEESP